MTDNSPTPEEIDHDPHAYPNAKIAKKHQRATYRVRLAYCRSMESNSSSPTATVDLYSLLKVDRHATEEEIHRAYKNLSTTFHPDKLPPSTSAEDREQVQQVFLEFKRASKLISSGGNASGSALIFCASSFTYSR